MNLFSGPLPSSTHKSLITVWAEERGSLDANNFEFSFGDAGRSRDAGYPMMSDGRILKMALAGLGERGKPIKVAVAVNKNNRGDIIKDGVEDASAVKVFSPPIELFEGDIINFKTLKNAGRTGCLIVSLLIELDL